MTVARMVASSLLLAELAVVALQVWGAATPNTKSTPPAAELLPAAAGGLGQLGSSRPLALLPALPKTHFSWCRFATPTDSFATLVDYARITHSVPVCPNANESQVAQAVHACYHGDGCGTSKGCSCSATLNCSLALNWSPYAKAQHGGADPTKTTAAELAYLREFGEWASNATRWAATASAQLGRDVRVGAVILEQGAFWQGASSKPEVRAALTAKNNAYYLAAQLAAPGAEIIQHNRGGWQLCPPGRPTCPEKYRNGTHDECTDPKLKRATDGVDQSCHSDGTFRNWSYTLDEDELGDSMSVSLYQVGELWNTVRVFNKTAETALAHGKQRVAPFVCLGCGFKRDVHSEKNDGGRWGFTFDWDYDVAYSFLLGAYVNNKLPWSGKPQPERYGLWGMATSPVFYASIIDTEGEHPNGPADLVKAREIRLRHFAAYVRGASLPECPTCELATANKCVAECANETLMVRNVECVKALWQLPPPPPPPLAKTTNPLVGLPALPKPHYSWFRYLVEPWSSDGGADNHATLVDYARITHSMPVVHCGDATTGCLGSKLQAEAAVAICVEAGGNCSISMDLSPYIDESEHIGRRVDPRGPPTAIEIDAMAQFRAFAQNMTRWVANASVSQPKGSPSIKIGAIGFDQEQVCGFCWSHDANGTCNASTYDSITAKNNRYAKAAAEELGPDVEVIWFNRGGVQQCMPNALSCTDFGEHGVCEEKKEGWMLSPPSNCDSAGFNRDTCSTLAPDEIGDSLSVSLYAVPEIGRTIQEFNRTAERALRHNKSSVVPYICLGCGYRRDVLYALGGSALYSNAWDYDEAYSYLLGAFVNAPQFAQEPG